MDGKDCSEGHRTNSGCQCSAEREKLLHTSEVCPTLKDRNLTFHFNLKTSIAFVLLFKVSRLAMMSSLSIMRHFVIKSVTLSQARTFQGVTEFLGDNHSTQLYEGCRKQYNTQTITKSLIKGNNKEVD